VAHTPSAIKRIRQAERRRVRNQARRSATRSSVRRAREALAKGTPDEAAAAVRDAGAKLDRAARKGTIHANNAGRTKSRLMRQLNAKSS